MLCNLKKLAMSVSVSARGIDKRSLEWDAMDWEDQNLQTRDGKEGVPFHPFSSPQQNLSPC